MPEQKTEMITYQHTYSCDNCLGQVVTTEVASHGTKSIYDGRCLSCKKFYKDMGKRYPYLSHEEVQNES